MSILAVDFGSIHTRAIFLDRIDGVYQLVARAEVRTTDGFPVNDLMVGFDRALQELTKLTGRTFTSLTGGIITPETAEPSGVNAFVATASLGRPMRVVVIGLVPEISVASAKRATSGTYAEVVNTISLDDGRNEEERLNAILLSHPDVILIAGGTQKGASDAIIELVNTAGLAVALMSQDRRPTVIYAGNSAIAERVKTYFEDMTQVLIAPNIRPMIEQEFLGAAQEQLSTAFESYKQKRSRAFTALAGMSQSGVMPTAQSYTTIARYLGMTRKENVLIMDIGSATSVLALTFNGAHYTTIRPELGVGHNAFNMLNMAGESGVEALLPFYPKAGELANFCANKTLRPMTIPQTLRETYIEHALVRVGARKMLQSTRPQWEADETRFDTIIGAGASLAAMGNPAYTAMLLLDIAQPTGVTRLFSDPFSLIPALGAVADANPEAVVQVLDADNLEPLGTAISISGYPVADKPAVKVKIALASGEETEYTINGGELWVYRLPLHQSAAVAVRVVRRGLKIGQKKVVKLLVKGGTAGLIIDTRGRSLVFGKTVADRAHQMPLWVSQVTGQTAHEIDPEWLAEPQPAEPVVTLPTTPTATPKAPKAGRFGRGKATEKKPETDRLSALAPDSTDDDDDLLKDLRNV